MSGTGNLIDRSLTILAGDPVAALGAASKQYVDARAIPPGYIDGLKMVWNSANSISTTSGACYINALGYALQFPNTLTLSGLSLTASTFYHLYGYSNAGTPAIELVTTAPASPYNGTARAKTGDTSRRYLGSVLTDASGNIYNFLQSGNLFTYRVQFDIAPFRALSNGSAVSFTSVSFAAVAPITSRFLVGRCINTTPNAATRITTSDASGDPTAGCFGVGPATTAYASFFLDSSQTLQYLVNATPTSGGVYFDTSGYTYER